MRKLWRYDNWIVEPFLHFGNNLIYNPITHRSVGPDSNVFKHLLSLETSYNTFIPPDQIFDLAAQGWIVEDNEDLLARHYLRIVNIEGNSHCNQRCNFCPVSVHPRSIHTMDLTFYQSIIGQLENYKKTIEGVFMINYNEPTVDNYFLERVKIIKSHGLPVCINTNGSGLTPNRVDEIMRLGGLRYLSINLSTLDAEEYFQERGSRQLDQILMKIDYINNLPLAEQMEIAVLGRNDDRHKRNFELINERFKNGYFHVRYFEIMDRAGFFNFESSLKSPIANLRGCENIGSRPLQHLTVNAFGDCIICCQDYEEYYKIGNLGTESVVNVLTGKKIQDIRAISYGLIDPPENFICQRCIFALSCNHANK